MISHSNRSVFKGIFLALACVPALMAVAPAQAADNNANDTQLAAAVESRLAQDVVFQSPGSEVHAQVHQGVVQLTGWVAYASDEVLADHLAAQVPGVQKVASNFHSWSSKNR